MSNKKKIAGVLLLLFIVLSNIYIYQYQEPVNENISLSITFEADQAFSPQVYYLTSEQTYEDGIVPSQVKSASYTQVGQRETLSVNLPGDVTCLRIDFGEFAQKIHVTDPQLQFNNKEITSVSLDFADAMDMQMIDDISGQKASWEVQTQAGDPYMVLAIDSDLVRSYIQDSLQLPNMVKHIMMCVFFDLVLFLTWLKWDKLTDIPRDLLANKRLIFNLAKNDFKSRFSGSFLGIVWAFVNPIVTVLLYWFVFQKALNVGTQSTKAGITVPFVLWLIAGLVPWFYFSEAWSSGTNSLIEYSYLVKKVVFKISALPVVKVVSSLFVHLFFVGFTLVLYTCYQYYPTLYALQILYYSFCMILFCLGLTYVTAAVVVFFRDLSQIIGIMMQVLMWMTPIMWNIDGMTLHPLIAGILKLNPMFYIVNGYRDALINKVWFWDRLDLTVYFWIVTLALLGIGTTVFKKLQVHFADVL